ncbi:MAG: GldG family protein [bacterium]
MKHKAILSVSGLVLVVVIFFMVNLLSNLIFKNAILDLTEERLYTLSEGTKKILKGCNDPITLKCYYSKTDAASEPGLKVYAERIDELLHEYKRYGKGNINLEFYDPRPDTEEEEWAQNYGLQPISISNGEQVYLGLVVTNGLGDEKTIPYFNPSREEFLEYDITKIVYDIGNPSKKVIGIISSLKVFGDNMPPNPYMGKQEDNAWVFIKELKKSYSVREIETSTKKIADDIDLLLVIHPKELNEETQFAIDQHIMKGKRAIFFVDPFSQIEKDDERQQNPNNPYAGFGASHGSELNYLFKNWGVEVPTNDIVADIKQATKVNTGMGKPVEYVVWLSLMDNYINKKDVITGKLESLLIPCPGQIVDLKKEGIEVMSLLNTSKEASKIEMMKMSYSHPQQLLDDYVKGSEEIILAAKVSGIFTSAFPHGRPEKKEDEKKEDEKTRRQEDVGSEDSNKEHISKCSNKNTIIVVADTDFLNDRYAAIVQNFLGMNIVNLRNDNLNFLFNAVENLTGSEDLINIRSRGKFSRPFTKVAEIEKKAEEQWMDDEKRLKKEVEEINKNLRELQQPQEGDKKHTVLSQAMTNEIKKFREKQRDSKRKLREVRNNLRQDKERLGNNLFILNTFLVPFIILVVVLAMLVIKTRRSL